MRIACLHTAKSNIDVFTNAARHLNLPQISLVHAVREDLLAAAERARGLTSDIESRTRDALLNLARDADAVLLTCSTLGPCIPADSAVAAVPMIRVDRALADEVTRGGGKVVVLCAVETTLVPTMQVFRDAAQRSGADVEVRLVPRAWSLFRAGKRAAYLSAIADAADDAYDEGASIIALAQASMAEAAGLVRRASKPLTSPSAAVVAAMKAAVDAG